MGCSASCKPCKPLCGSPGDDYSVNFGGGEALPTEDAEGEEQPAELDQESSERSWCETVWWEILAGKKMAFWCWCSFTHDFRRNSMSLRSLQALRNTQWMLQAQHEPERWVPSMLKWQSKPNSKANMQLVVLMFGDVSVVDGSALLVT